LENRIQEQKIDVPLDDHFEKIEHCITNKAIPQSETEIKRQSPIPLKKESFYKKLFSKTMLSIFIVSSIVLYMLMNNKKFFSRIGQ